MAQPPENNATLANTSRAGSLSANTIHVSVDSVTRSIGSSGDPVRVAINLVDDPIPGDWDLLGTFTLTISPATVGGSAADLVLAGYRLKQVTPTAFGRDIGDASGTVTARAAVWTLETVLRSLRDGRGGLLTEGLLNELAEDGWVDTESSTYRTNKELADLCMSATGLPYEACPASIDTLVGEITIDAPGPLDWGNARPLPELEALLGRVGWTVVVGNDGVVRCKRLARAGEPISLPTAITDYAEPFSLGNAPGLRASRIVVTSGATRVTVITERDLSSLVWVAFDPRLGTWLTQADWDVLYPGEIGPEGLTALQTGPTGEEIVPGGTPALSRVYTALALTDDDQFTANRFVSIPSTGGYGDFAAFKGTPGVVEARCCVAMGGEQLVNVPALDTDAAVRIDGLATHSKEGVFVLPAEAVYARVNGARVGRRSDLRALAGADLTITFAHESNTGDFLRDYYAIGFQIDVDGVTMVQMSELELQAAIDDPNVVKVGAPMLKAVVTRDQGAPNDEFVNQDAIEAVARQFARALLAADELQSGVVELRGIVGVEPGDASGLVSQVLWDVSTQRTLLLLNQHERPRSAEEFLSRSIGNSIAAGVSRLSLERSNVALSDARSSLTAERATVAGGEGAPEANATQRGRERAQGTSGVVVGDAPRTPRPSFAQATEIYAVITGATPMPEESNRWLYDWEEVRLAGTEAVATGALRTSATHGQAINRLEHDNTDTNFMGIDLTTVDEGLEPAAFPSGGIPLRLHGPFPQGTTDYWYFEGNSKLVGACP